MNRIKGLTIEIEGNTTKLQKALQEVNGVIRTTSSNLRDIDKLLKFNPTSTTLLKQKQTELKTEIEAVKAKIDTERTALEQLKQKDSTPEVVEQQNRLEREIIDNENKLKSLQKEMKEFGSVAKQQFVAVGASMKDFGSKITGIGNAMKSAGRSMSMYVTTPIVGGFASAVKEGAEFEKQMSAVKSVAGASEEEFVDLKNAAMEWGEKSVFSAKESADALYYMGLAGWDAKESVDALGGVLNLAAAGATDLGTTSDIVTDSMTAFKISASEMTNGLMNAEHFSNVLAAAMSNSNTTIEMLGESFQYVAPLAGAMGYSVEDTSLALGLMANSGIKASMAGTSLRTMLTNMADPTDDMAEAMDTLNISLDDGKGNMKSLEQIMQDLRNGFGELKMPADELNRELANLDAAFEDGTISEKEYNDAVEELTERAYGAEGALKAQAASMLSGKRGLAGLLAIVETSDEEYAKLRDAINEADEAFVRHEGKVYTLEEAYKKFGSAVDTSDAFEKLGAAEGMAGIQLDNLSGKWTLFQSKLGTAKINITQAADGPLNSFVDKLSEMVDKFNSLDSVQQQNILKWAGIAAAAGPLLIVFGTIAGAIGNIISLGGSLVTGIGTLSGFITATAIPAISSLIAAVAPILAAAAPFIAVGAAIVGVGMLVYRNWDTIKAKAKELVDKVSTNWNKFKENTSKKWEEMRKNTSEKWEAIRKCVSDKVSENGGGIGGVIKMACELYKIGWEKTFETIDKITDGKLSIALKTVKDKMSENGGGIGGVIKTGLDAYTAMWDVAFSLMDKVTGGKFSNIFNTISTTMNSTKDFVKSAIDKIKGFFDFEWRLPKIKLPHFSLDGEFSFIPPRVPRINVDWYKKAYSNGVMFKTPTVIPTINGLKGFGDGNGAEVVIGANKLKSMVGGDEVAKRVDTLTNILVEYLPVIAQGGNVYLDKNTLVGKIAPDINRKLGLAF